MAAQAAQLGNPAHGGMEDCFGDSWRAVVYGEAPGLPDLGRFGEDEVLLVHGTARITDPQTGKVKGRGPHAWVEMKAGKWVVVWDPQAKRTFGWEEYKREIGARVVARYTGDQAAAMALRYKHTGPWRAERVGNRNPKGGSWPWLLAPGPGLAEEAAGIVAGMSVNPEQTVKTARFDWNSAAQAYEAVARGPRGGRIVIAQSGYPDRVISAALHKGYRLEGVPPQFEKHLYVTEYDTVTGRSRRVRFEPKSNPSPARARLMREFNPRAAGAAGKAGKAGAAGGRPALTLTDLYKRPWSGVYEYPNVGYPHRAEVLAENTYTSEHGVKYLSRVLTNRTRTRWWLEIKSEGWLKGYWTTTSRKLAEEWIAAVKGGR